MNGAKIEKLAGGYKFAEGPAVDSEGNIYFIDIPPNRIYKWSVDGELSTFIEIEGGANGLYFDKNGDLLACAWLSNEVVSISPDGIVTVLTDNYNGKPLNSPNDLWIDPEGGVYFSTPHDNPEFDGQYVFYLSPDRKTLKWIKEVTVKTNGLLGTPDGKRLYVIEYHSNRCYVLDIYDNGTYSEMRFFAPAGYDGLTIDSEGNVYLTGDDVSVYDSSGNYLETIEIPGQPTNMCFGGRDNRTLFITTETSFFSLRMKVNGK